MAAYLNRTISMVTGNGNGNGDGDDTTDSTMNRNARTARPDILMGETHDDKSPLQIFVRAKKRINTIFGDVETYVSEAAQFACALQEDPHTDIVNKCEQETFEGFVHKVTNIREVLLRDHMKVAFFGRTSNGKSTVINAMLHDKILPSGIGHTTNCFCQVEGVNGTEAYLLTEGSKDKLSVTSIKQLANALCQEKLSESSLVRIFWPRERCKLLRDDVVFVDSPGVDVSANLDDWIDNHCLNADVFVLVLNAESTIMRVEKQFFHTVSQRLSKPNVFILNNRWDASADEPEFQESVKSQHTERCIDFLTKELKVSNEREAAERVFFISAREALNARIAEAQGKPAQSASNVEGFQSRYFDFQDFERKFEECISQSAVKTKFQQHSSRGKTLADQLRAMLQSIIDRINELHESKIERKTALVASIEGRGSEMKQATSDVKSKLHQIVDEARQRVFNALNDEIWRLEELVNEFDMQFHTERVVIDVYKLSLNKHIEDRLCARLHARLSPPLAVKIEALQNEMTERLQALIPNDAVRENARIAVRAHPFELSYSLKCETLCAGFQEDLEFKFSWGIVSMVKRFITSRRATPNQHPLRQQYIRSSSSPSPSATAPSTDFALALISRFALAPIGTQGTVGGLLCAGVLFKVFDWRVLFSVGTLCGCIYMFERLSWTNAAKERAFKEQYVRYASRNLKMVVDFVSTNCAHQVQQQLTHSFASLCRNVDSATSDMSEELKAIESQLNELETKHKHATMLRNKANYIQHELDVFEENYIRIATK